MRKFRGTVAEMLLRIKMQIADRKFCETNQVLSLLFLEGIAVMNQIKSYQNLFKYSVKNSKQMLLLDNKIIRN